MEKSRNQRKGCIKGLPLCFKSKTHADSEKDNPDIFNAGKRQEPF